MVKKRKFGVAIPFR